MSLSRKAAVVGAFEHPTRFAPDKTMFQIMAESVRGALLRQGLRKHLEDNVLEVQLRALEAARVGPMPPDLPHWRALGRTIAKNFAIDERRKWYVRKKYDAGLCEEPDACGPVEIERGRDPVDAKRCLAVLKDQFDGGAMPEMGGEILWAAAEDVPQGETAEETGLSERQVKRRLRAMRQRFSKGLGEVGLRDGFHPAREKSDRKAGT